MIHRGPWLVQRCPHIQYLNQGAAQTALRTAQRRLVLLASLKLDCFMQAVGIKEVSMADSEDEASDSETEAANALRAKSRWEPLACIGQSKGIAGCCAQYIGP